MKNNNVSIAFAAFFGFVSAVIYIILYMMELLPNIAAITVAGKITAVIILLTLSFMATKQHIKTSNALIGSLHLYGCWLVWIAVICICLCVLLESLSLANTMLYTGVLFAVIFIWKFMLIMWALFLCGAISCHRCTQNNCSNF